jgi:hypothetical protein
MKVDDMFPSKYLHGSDIKAEITVTIAKVAPEKMHNPRKGEITGFVLYVERGSKGIVLGKELANQIADALNIDDTDHWPGKKIILYPEQMTVAGERVTAIRARSALTTQPAPAGGNGKFV